MMEIIITSQDLIEVGEFVEDKLTNFLLSTTTNEKVALFILQAIFNELDRVENEEDYYETILH